MRFSLSSSVSVATISFICLAYGQDGFLGAEKVMEKVERELQSGASKESSGADVLRMIDRLIEGTDVMSDREAAETWVSMATAYFEIPASKRSELERMNPPLKMETLLTALPVTSAWDDISEVVGGLPDQKSSLAKDSLELMIAVLRSSKPERVEAMQGLKQKFSKLHSSDTYALKYAERQFEELEKHLNEGKVSAISVFKEELDARESGLSNDQFRSSSINVPQLVGELSEAEAEELILRAVKLEVNFSIGHEPTRRLFAKMLMENPEVISTPIWVLIETADEIPLFEMFVEKFPGGSDWQRSSAESRYVSLLLGKLELDKAERFIKQKQAANEVVRINTSDFKAFSDEVVRKLIPFFGKLLEENASLPYWSAYLDLAEKAGMAEDVMENVREAALAADKGTELKVDLEGYVLNGLLNAGKVDEALEYLRDLVAEHQREGSVFNREGADAFMQRSLQMIRMADLLGKEELKEEGFISAKLAFEAVRKYSNSQYVYDDYVRLLVDHGRGPEAEVLILEELVAMSQPAILANNERTALMTALAYVYAEAGRHEDVVKQLDDSEMWDAPDLRYVTEWFASRPMLLIAAESLFEVGRVDDASRVLDRLLQKHPNMDAGYTLLLKIGGEGILANLDSLYAMNRFQERPLIWKAQYLLDAGELEEAEKTVRSAIAIDPSDGEQGKGDRMRAYAVLAEIMAKKGDEEQAEFLRGVVRAIRLSESADDWWAAGMRKRAIEIYEASLKEFADAYCIQSRLALRYSEAGEFEKAAEHYRRAFELMPESFGRVESHCFGCEGAFTGELAQGIAEDVFLRLAEEMPDRAQVFYLLGYLREQQGRDVDAAEQFAKAVEIDPLYINAWKKLGGVADSAGFSKERKDEISLVLYRLNPRGRHLYDVADLAKLWDTVLDVAKTYEAVETGPLFELKLDRSSPHANRDYSYFERSETEKQPRMQLSRSKVINSVVSVLEYLQKS